MNISELDTRAEYYRHIVLSGGSSMYPGLPSRLEKDIKERYLNEILKGKRCYVKSSHLGHDLLYTVVSPMSRAILHALPVCLSVWRSVCLSILMVICPIVYHVRQHRAHAEVQDQGRGSPSQEAHGVFWRERACRHHEGQVRPVSCHAMPCCALPYRINQLSHRKIAVVLMIERVSTDRRVQHSIHRIPFHFDRNFNPHSTFPWTCPR